MHPVISRARVRLVAALILLALAVPAALAAAQYPKYWLWIALELTPMTWVQTVVLMLAAAAAGVTAVALKVRGASRATRLPYWLLAAGFTYLAVDDRFALHERLRDRYLAPRDVRIPGLDFLAPGDIQMLLMGVAGLIALPLVIRVLRRDRLALVLFLLGVVASAASLAMDSIDPATMPQDVERLSQTLEECVELLAGCLFLAALGVHLLGQLDPRAGHGAPSADPLAPPVTAGPEVAAATGQSPKPVTEAAPVTESAPLTETAAVPARTADPAQREASAVGAEAMPETKETPAPGGGASAFDGARR